MALKMNLSIRNLFLVLGSGPIRIGQEWSLTMRLFILKGYPGSHYEAIIMNSNPETVSTGSFSVSDKLYLSRWCLRMCRWARSSLKVLSFSLAGQPLILFHCPRLVWRLQVPKWRTWSRWGSGSCASSEGTDIPQPPGQTATNEEEAVEAARIGFLLWVRPSSCFGWPCHGNRRKRRDLRSYMRTAVKAVQFIRFWWDSYIVGDESAKWMPFLMACLDSWDWSISSGQFT